MQILELARNAQRLFEHQEPRQKRRLLNFVLSNCSWKDGEVVATFRQPFDLLAETTAIAARQKAGSTANSAKSEIWLGTWIRTRVGEVRVRGPTGKRHDSERTAFPDFFPPRTPSSCFVPVIVADAAGAGIGEHDGCGEDLRF